MSFHITPNDNNYLTSSLLFKQMQQNAINLSLNTLACTEIVTPQISLDGSGRAYLTGSISLNGSTSAGTELFTLPAFLSLANDISIGAVTENSSGVYSNTVITLASATAGVIGVNVTFQGEYASTPTVSTTGNGEGAVFVPVYKAVFGTPAINTAQSGSGSYAPNDTVTLAGGTGTPAVVTILETKVMSATVEAGGTGGTNGTQTVTGTTGTGTKFTASVTVAGGAITAVLSILTHGIYTVNPTVLTNEPVTGAGLTGAALSVVMGIDLVEAFTVTQGGSYTGTLPTSPLSQASTSGSGTGASFNVNWAVRSIGVTSPGEGYDNSSAILITGGGLIAEATAVLVLGSASPNIAGELSIAGSIGDVISLDGIVFFVNSYS
jgi:hypothetical protein